MAFTYPKTQTTTLFLKDEDAVEIEKYLQNDFVRKVSENGFTRIEVDKGGVFSHYCPSLFMTFFMELEKNESDHRRMVVYNKTTDLKGEEVGRFKLKSGEILSCLRVDKQQDMANLRQYDATSCGGSIWKSAGITCSSVTAKQISVGGPYVGGIFCLSDNLKFLKVFKEEFPDNIETRLSEYKDEYALMRLTPTILERAKELDKTIGSSMSAYMERAYCVDSKSKEQYFLFETSNNLASILKDADKIVEKISLKLSDKIMETNTMTEWHVILNPADYNAMKSVCGLPDTADSKKGVKSDLEKLISFRESPLTRLFKEANSIRESHGTLLVYNEHKEKIKNLISVLDLECSYKTDEPLTLYKVKAENSKSLLEKARLAVAASTSEIEKDYLRVLELNLLLPKEEEVKKEKVKMANKTAEMIKKNTINAAKTNAAAKVTEKTTMFIIKTLEGQIGKELPPFFYTNLGKGMIAASVQSALHYAVTEIAPDNAKAKKVAALLDLANEGTMNDLGRQTVDMLDSVFDMIIAAAESDGELKQLMEGTSSTIPNATKTEEKETVPLKNGKATEDATH